MEPENKGDGTEVVVVPPATKDTSQADKKSRTPLEKKKFTADRLLKEIAEEEGKAVAPSTIEDDSKPLTMGDLKRIRRDESQSTALSMANEIEDDEEREQVIDILENRIIPSGDPKKDFQLAMNAISSEKNRQIASIAAGKRPVATRSSNGGAPIKTEAQFVPTDEELAAAKFAKKSKPEDIKKFILKARALMGE